MTSDLVQRLRNLHQDSSDPDTVDEAAATLESLEGVCSSHLANIKRLSEYLELANQHIAQMDRVCKDLISQIEVLRDMVRVLEGAVIWDREEEMSERIVQEANEIEFKNAVDNAGMVKLTDEQAQRVLNAIREAGL